MTIIVEQGAGLTTAESNASVAFIDAYFTARGIATWTGTDTVKEQAARKSTEYIEKTFGHRIMGVKEFRGNQAAKGSFGLTANAGDTETVTIGAVVYTFNTVLGGANSILIGTYATDTLDNLVAAVNGADGEGTTYGTGTVEHSLASAEVGRGDTITVQADENGTGPNSIATTTTATDGTWSSATLVGGSDYTQAQGLSFPRNNLWDRDGVKVLGMPVKMMQATAEYALRALTAELLTDPTVDGTGRVVSRKKEKVGPIEEETEYAEGSAITQLIKPYPAADMLLAEYLAPTGHAIRG